MVAPMIAGASGEPTSKGKSLTPPVRWLVCTSIEHRKGEGLSALGSFFLKSFFLKRFLNMALFVGEREKVLLEEEENKTTENKMKKKWKGSEADSQVHTTKEPINWDGQMHNIISTVPWEYGRICVRACSWAGVV